MMDLRETIQACRLANDLSIAKEVKVLSPDEAGIDIPEKLKAILYDNCHSNSLGLANYFDCQLVYGVYFIDNETPTFHTWNKQDDVYFDYTYSQIKDNDKKESYFSLIEGTVEKLEKDYCLFTDLIDVQTQFLWKLQRSPEEFRKIIDELKANSNNG